MQEGSSIAERSLVHNLDLQEVGARHVWNGEALVPSSLRHYLRRKQFHIENINCMATCRFLLAQRVTVPAVLFLGQLQQICGPQKMKPDGFSKYTTTYTEPKARLYRAEGSVSFTGQLLRMRVGR